MFHHTKDISVLRQTRPTHQSRYQLQHPFLKKDSFMHDKLRDHRDSHIYQMLQNRDHRYVNNTALKRRQTRLANAAILVVSSN